MEIIALIPTYNEAGNIEGLIKKILQLPLDIGVLVVDDNSPDKTGEAVKRLMKTSPKVSLLLRKENKGRGWAGIDGFKEALKMGAEYLVEMDGDGSHDPRFINDFYKSIKNCDIVIGSRYAEGGRDEERTILRRAISGFARRYLSFVLGVKVKDVTSGFRMFKRHALEKILPHLKARDPFIVSEVLYYSKTHNLKITESPIEFLSRGTGVSKLGPATLIKYLFKALLLHC